MSATVDQLLREALLLPIDSRTELVEAILEQSNPSPEFLARQMEIVEIRRQRLKDGVSILIPAHEAHNIVLESLQARA